jgi:glycosyltransferase involved in cell wall biosynthesis
MKILQVIPYFYPAYAFGGPVRVAFQVSKELAKRGHEVVVYTTDAKDWDSRLNTESVEIVDGIKTHYMKNLTMILVKKSNLFITPKIISRSKNEIKDFDIVHLHEYRTFQNIIIHHYAKKYNIPYVLQAHGSLPRIMQKQSLKWIYDEFFGYKLLKDAAMVIALNKIELEQYRERFVPTEKIAIVPNGIDLSEFINMPYKGEFKKKYSLNENDKIILYLGRIHRTKGIDILIKSFKEVIDSLDCVKLILVGPDDGYFNDVKDLIKKLALEKNIIITGPLYGKEKLEAYTDADIYVLPSRYETFPMSVLEAYACSKPVIASNVGGLKELILNGETGLLFESENIEQLANNILSLINDREKSKKIGIKGKQFVYDNFSIERITDVLVNCYKKIILS